MSGMKQFEKLFEAYLLPFFFFLNQQFRQKKKEGMKIAVYKIFSICQYNGVFRLFCLTGQGYFIGVKNAF